MTTHKVTLVFEDGRVVKFDASEDDNIYFACLKNKVRILTDCLEGACATARACALRVHTIWRSSPMKRSLQKSLTGERC